MVAALAGGYAGGPLARSLPKQVVRGLVGFIGFLMSGVFFGDTLCLRERHGV